MLFLTGTNNKLNLFYPHVIPNRDENTLSDSKLNDIDLQLTIIMLVVGLTGGIGSGKSTIAKIFESLGIPVYDADKEAKQLMETDGVLKTAIIKTFGTDIYKKEKLDRELLASIVFNDNYKLDLLNSFV